MMTLATTRTQLHRILAALPPVWRNDPVFRWAAVGAGIALVMLAIRVLPSSAIHPPAPKHSGPTARARSVPSHSAAMPKIAPGLPLTGVTIKPTPEERTFGTVPAAAPK